jgi:hypothetical protein
MSALSPTAKRFIELALARQGSSKAAAEWHSWMRYSDTEIPPHVAQLAIHALSGLSLSLEAEIAKEDVSDTIAAQLENDLGYIADIEVSLTE